MLPLQTYQSNTSYSQEILWMKMKANKFINLISGMTVLSLEQPTTLFSKDIIQMPKLNSSKKLLIGNFHTEMPSTNQDENHTSLPCWYRAS